MYTREQIAKAYEMKREKIAQLQAEIKIAQALLMATQAELTELQWLDGKKLVTRMLWEDPDEVLKPKAQYFQSLENAVTGGLV